jgi:hypothetical protein
MAKDEDLSLALGLVTVRSDPEDQPEDEVADREEHRRMIQSPDVKGSERWFPTPSGGGVSTSGRLGKGLLARYSC